jgi:transcriptional regulator with XRE-family HTH domain
MTDKVSFSQLRDQAIALRRAGKSRTEIKAILGIGSNETLGKALRGEPPPEWTLRPRAKDDLHAKARDLRGQGRTYNEIAAELGVSKGSISRWVRDLPRQGRLSYEESRRRNAQATAAYFAARREVTEAARRDLVRSASAEIGPLNDREILIAGSIAYWCEGGKNKPCRRPANRVVFINSDPGLVTFFLRFLAVAGVDPQRLICQLHIHESADVEAAQRHWLQVTGVPADQFRRPSLKLHNPKTVRKNSGEDYYGCLRIEVRRSTDLYLSIEGWAAAAMVA